MPSSDKDSKRSKRSANPAPSSSGLGGVKFLGALVVVLVGVYYYSLQRWIEVFGPFKYPKPYNVKKCKTIEGIAGCENIDVYGDYAFMACGDVAARQKWWPPIQRYDKTESRNDNAYIYNFKEKSLKQLKLLRFEGDFRLHGISVHAGETKNKIVVAFVNHKRTGSCIELFDHRLGTTELIHFETVCHPLIKTPNDVALASRKSFYVTNYLASDTYLWQRFEAFTMRRWNNVVYRDENGDVKVAADEISGANGVILSPNEKYVYVASSFRGVVHMYERQMDGTLREVDTVDLEFLPDNLGVDPTTGEILVAGHANARSFTAHVEHPKLPSPSLVYKISNTTSSEKYFGKKYSTKLVFADDGKKMSASTVAVVHPESKTVLIGGIFQKGVLECTDILG